MAWVLSGIMLAVVAFLFLELWSSFASDPYFVEKWKALTWNDFATSLTKHDGLPLAQLLFSLIAPALVYWGQRRLRTSRLFLSDSQLRHRSGLPLWLGNLTRQNWSLSLDDFRSGQMAFTLSGQVRGNAPLAMYFLSWKAAQNRPRLHALTQRRLAPASWFLLGQEAREPVRPPKGLFWRSLNLWTTPEGRAVLQSAFDCLPLVTALRAQAVPVPAFSTSSRMGMGGGVDLMAYPRIKAVVLSSFGLMVSAGLAFHLLRHQHYFESPPLWVWVAPGICCALAVWWWQAAAQQEPGEPSLKPTQGVVAALLGIAATLLAPSVLLGANLVFTPAQEISFNVRNDPLGLQPDDSSIPAFRPSQALDFWASLPASTQRQITVRKGLFGTWQYDSAPLEDEVSAFYQTHSRR